VDKKERAYVWKKDKHSDQSQIKPYEKKAIPTYTGADKLTKKKQGGIQRSVHFKPILTAGISAIMIGTIMGMIMIHLFTNLADAGEPEDHTAVTSTLPKEDEQTKEEEDEGNNEKEGQAVLSGMNAYVLQAGVFSNQENADDSAKEYDKAGFITVIWERDEQYYVLVGISETKDKGIDVAEEVGSNDLDIYVKEWMTEKSQAKLDKSEEQWIKAFEKQWETTLGLLEKEKKIPVEEWASLIKNLQLQSESVQAVEETINEFLKDGETELSVQEAQRLLIKTWKQYEQIK